jgi:hypothetical protein
MASLRAPTRGKRVQFWGVSWGRSPLSKELSKDKSEAICLTDKLLAVFGCSLSPSPRSVETQGQNANKYREKCTD